MPIDYKRLLGMPLPEVAVSISRRDTMLYALGVGVGEDPCDERQLRFTYEKNLLALPSMATVYPAMAGLGRLPDTGITRNRVVHGEQGFRLHRPFPVEANLTGQARVTGIVDKGEGNGALVYVTGETRDKASGELIATITSTSFCRADGGFGGPTGHAKTPHPMPERPADMAWDFATPANLALIYRLSGDYNPLHVEPAYARTAGFEIPILHGRATFGIAAHGLLRLCCGYDAARLVAMDARFTSPVYPGETLRTQVWLNDRGPVSFRVSVPARGVTALDNGVAEISGDLVK